MRLQTLAAQVLRGDVLPERIPATGLIILRDGKAQVASDGNPLEVSPEGIEALLSLWPIFEAFRANCV